MFPVGDVPGEPDDPNHLAVVVDRLALDPDPRELLVGADPVFDVDGPPRREPFHRRLDRLPVVRVNGPEEVPGVLPERRRGPSPHVLVPRHEQEFVPVAGEHPEAVDGAVGDLAESALGSFGLLSRAVLLDGVQDPVGEELVLFVARSLPEVVGGAGGDSVARHRLRPLPGEQHEREVRMVGADRVQKVDAVGPGHLVVGDDAVRRPALSLEPFDPRVGARRRVDVDTPVLALQHLPCEVRKPGLVVDVEDANAVVHTDPPGRYGYEAMETGRAPGPTASGAGGDNVTFSTRHGERRVSGPTDGLGRG